ncbi:YciI family protein [Thalassococcus lentus]|uniref:YciI family protein n=1 Tax=Thalassococcus lentus TaxID=1210524 RepID=A0ABT4XTN5_9RHOB|nr:YciI family protein [Thalassococcus lentus]MDA7425306.1 YciI family protein [Thalassococcus lentus]
MSNNIDILELQMVSWTNYKSEAKARGALALELYAAVSTPAGEPEDVKANLPAHLAYQAELERSGNLAFAGPMSDESGDNMQGIGLIIYRAESFEEAISLAEGDPMHASGARSFVLRRWLINEGSLTLSVGLSTGHAVMG